MTEDAIPAATLIVVRDRPGLAPELLMVERAEGMAFAAGALVFPGGRIDEADRQFGERLGADPAAVAAIRETIEETAIPVGLTSWPRREHSSRSRPRSRRAPISRASSIRRGPRLTRARSPPSRAGSRSSTPYGASTPCSSS